MYVDLIDAYDVIIVFERFDLFLLSAKHKYIHQDFWPKAKSFEHGSRCTAAAALPLYLWILMLLWLQCARLFMPVIPQLSLIVVSCAYDSK